MAEVLDEGPSHSFVDGRKKHRGPSMREAAVLLNHRRRRVPRRTFGERSQACAYVHVIGG